MATRETLGATALSISSCFPHQLGADGGEPGEIAAGPSQAGDEALGHRIAGYGEDDRDRPGGLLGGFGSGRGCRDDDVDVQPDELGGERGQSLILELGGPMLDHHVLTFDVAQVAQPLPERLVEERRHVTQQADPGDLPGRSLGRGGGRRGEEAESESGLRAPPEQSSSPLHRRPAEHSGDLPPSVDPAQLPAQRDLMHYDRAASQGGMDMRTRLAHSAVFLALAWPESFSRPRMPRPRSRP
jgi:hypothetical protein